MTACRPKRGLAGLAGLLLLLVLALAPVPGTVALAQQPTQGLTADWEAVASRAETTLDNERVASRTLETLRKEIADWRKRLTEEQNASSARIEILKSQIAALGPPPGEGQTESADITARRNSLNAQLAELQAPSLAAVEALSRAEAIIQEIDRRLRERQADALLKLSPSPLNPINWPAGVAVLTQGMKTLGQEVGQSWADPARRTDLRNNLPLILLFLVMAGLLVWKGPRFMERLSRRLQAVSIRARDVLAAVVSLGQIVVPVFGAFFLVVALVYSGMMGPRLSAFVGALPNAAFAFFSALWLGSWLFPTEAAGGRERAGLRLTDRPAEGRFLAAMIGLVAAAEVFRQAFITDVRPPLSLAAQSVWAAPLVILVSVFVFRLGVLLRGGARGASGAGEEVLFRNRLIRLIGTGAAVLAVVAPLLAVIGYVAAANAIIWPTVHSLGLIGLIILLQRFGTDIYLIVTRGDESARDELLPVLWGFALSLASLPVFALIWGARDTDIAEVWAKFVAGVSIGGVRVSPAAFLAFAVIFAAGYAATRLLQGALKSSILPRTKIEKGAQNAISAGVGYLGIVLAAIVAVNAAGIDLSSLAIVIGALSVGIGLGLQNIVSNFVSGIILLVERPISEGDMIEVGGKIGIVRAISVRSTRIETFDRTDVIVPNGDLVSGVVTNWTRSNMNGRLVQQFTVAHGSDTRKVQAILQEAADAQPLAMMDPPPNVGFIGYSPDGLIFEVRIILADLNLKGDLQTSLLHDVLERFAAAGIELPARPGLAAEAAAVPRRPKAAARRPPPKADPRQVMNDPDEGIDPDRR